MHKKVTFFFITISFLLLVSCNSGNIIKPVKNEPSITAQVNNSKTNVEVDKVKKKTEQLEKTIKEKPTLFEQLKFAFYELDSRDSFTEKNNGFDSVGFLNFTTSILKEFLRSEQSYIMSELDYNKLSAKIRVFPLKNGKMYTYSGSAKLFGESGAPSYAFLQQKTDGKIKISVLYDNVFKDVLNVIHPSEDENLIVLTGRDRNQQAWKAFVDGFYVGNGVASNVKILEDYDDGFWRVNSKNGTISLMHFLLSETYINKTPGNVIEVDAGDAKLVLSFNKELKKYNVAKASK